MAAATGPPCEGCGKRVSKKRITKCPRCNFILCLDCVCPNKCFGSGAKPKPPKEIFWKHHSYDDTFVLSMNDEAKCNAIHVRCLVTVVRYERNDKEK